jgi:hypothetical protein
MGPSRQSRPGRPVHAAAWGPAGSGCPSPAHGLQCCRGPVLCQTSELMPQHGGHGLAVDQQVGCKHTGVCCPCKHTTAAHLPHGALVPEVCNMCFHSYWVPLFDVYLLLLRCGSLQERPQATAAVVQDLVSAFPKAPDCVTDVKGPLMELQRVRAGGKCQSSRAIAMLGRPYRQCACVSTGKHGLLDLPCPSMFR